MGEEEELLIIGNWKDDLIMCPSQCELPIEYRERKFTLYLRWRWDDPWTGAIIENEGTSSEVWYGDLDIGFYTHEQLEECKKEATKKATTLIHSLTSKQD